MFDETILEKTVNHCDDSIGSSLCKKAMQMIALQTQIEKDGLSFSRKKAAPQKKKKVPQTDEWSGARAQESIQSIKDLALIVASFHGNEAHVELLIQAGANPNVTTDVGRNALTNRELRRWRPPDLVKMLIEAVALAETNKDHSHCMFLIKAGANTKNEDGYTGLMWACERGRATAAERLIWSGANINATNDNSYTALMMASESGHEAVVEKLLNTRGNTALMLASHNRHNVVQRQQRKSVVDLDAQTKPGGWTALMFACRNGHEGVVKKLIQAGADINAVNDNGLTASNIACYWGQNGIQEKLVKARAETKTKNKDVKTALLIASPYERDVVLGQLREVVAYIDDRTKQGCTALMLAADRGHKAVVKQLIASGANVNTVRRSSDRCFFPETALTVARENKHADIVEELEKYSENEAHRASGKSDIACSSVENGDSGPAAALQFFPDHSDAESSEPKDGSCSISSSSGEDGDSAPAATL